LVAALNVIRPVSESTASKTREPEYLVEEHADPPPFVFNKLQFKTLQFSLSVLVNNPAANSVGRIALAPEGL